MNHNELFQKAYQLHMQGQLNQAIDIYKKILQKIRHPESLSLLGSIYIKNKDTFKQGMSLIEESITINKNIFFSHLFYAIGLMHIGRYKDAKIKLLTAKKLDQRGINLEIEFNLAICEQNLNNIKNAKIIYKNILSKNEKHLPSLINLGNIFFTEKEFEKSCDFFELALRINEDHYIFKMLSNNNLKLKNYEKSNYFLQEAKKIKVDDDLRYIEVDLLARDMDFENAKKILDSCLIKSDENFIKTKIRILRDEGKLDEALSECKYYLSDENQKNKDYIYKELSIINRLKKNFVEAIENLDLVKNRMGESNHELNSMYALIYDEMKNDKAESFYKLAVKGKDSETIKNFGFWLLKNKKYTEAFHQLIKIKKKDSADMSFGNHSKNRKLVIYSDQGIGDQIFYLRFIKMIKDHFLSIEVFIDKRLKKIAQNIYKDIVFYDLEDFKETGKKNEDEFIYLSNIVFMVNEKISSYPGISYEANRQKKIYKNNNITIGLSWRSIRDKVGEEKSVHINYINDLVKKNQFCNFINLQYGELNDEFNTLSLNANFQLFPQVDKKNDFESLFDLINECDLVITCSNVTAHFAGILNKETYLLLPYSKGSIWYWHNKDQKSLWYPSINIIRQENYNNWDAEMIKVQEIINNIN